MSTRTIELETIVDASPDAVFSALTEGDRLARWFPSSAESDPRPGGSFSYRFEFDDPSRDHTYSGEYAEVSPGRAVRYPWQTGLGPTEVAFALEPAGDGTRVRLAHSGWGEGGDWDESVEQHRQGWGAFLDNLKAYLERGEDRRGELLGMKTPATV
jgi:uncharacterized protein YndB with AHSA1/START domain